MSTDPKAAGAPAAATTTTEAPSLIDEILAETKIAPKEEGYDVAKQGVQALITELLGPGHEGRVDPAFVDALIAELDAKISKQVDQVIHHPDFQKLESAWRGLKFVIDRTDFRENVKVELLNYSKDDLIGDFEDANGDVTKTAYYRKVYTHEYGQYGGKPYAAVISNYEMSPGPQDVALLRNVAAVAAMSHAPFFAAAGPQFFGEKDFLSMPHLRDLKAIFEGPQYAKWQSFRESEDSRYVGLLLPRFLLRLPYGPDTVRTKAFNYKEDVVGDHDAYLWGNATYAFATRLTDSFAKFRWCPNIIGPQAGGTVEDLPLHQYEAMGQVQTKIPTEVLISDRREYELAEEGFIALTFQKDSDNACFFSANSVQKPKYFGQSPEGKTAELNYRLGTQLPYLFVVNRIAHYLKVIQREQIGMSKDRRDLETELNKWIRQYVVEMDVTTPDVRAKRPLREASVQVTDVEGNAGWYKVEIKVRPHFKYMGASFELSLVGKLDKE